MRYAMPRFVGFAFSFVMMFASISAQGGVFANATAIVRSPPTTPAIDEGSKLYIGHSTRLTALIPKHWSVDTSDVADYSGADGFIGSEPIANETIDLTGACTAEATQPRFGPNAKVHPVTWRDQPACRIDSDQRDITALVLATPEPFSISSIKVLFVAIFTDPAHFAEIVETVDFSSSRVTPAAFVESVIDIVEARSLFRNDIDWTRVRREAMDAISNPEMITDTHSVILGVLSALHDVGDGHSFFMSPWQRDAFLQGGTTGHEWPSGHRLDDNLGYIALPGIAGVPETLRTYGTMANKLVEAIDTETTCGWVVDLRDNWGGSYAPMVTGVESLLGDGEILRWRMADGSEKRVIYRGGHLYDNGQDLGRFSDVAPYQLKHDQPPVAVLLGLQTASSGEATALAFVGRPRTRSFGQLTYGFTTANYGHTLYDGSWLVLAEAWMADRTGAIHPSGVQPDETVGASWSDSASGDPVLDAAVAWLNQQPECAR